MEKYKLDSELNHVYAIKLSGVKGYMLPIMAMYQKNMYKELDKIEGITYETIKLAKGFKLYVIIPNDIKDNNRSCIIDYHGGAFIYKGWESHFIFAAETAKRCNSIVIYVDYRLAYNTKYLTPINDSILAYKWILDNANKYNIDINKMAIMGDSAGGYIALKVREYIESNNLVKPLGLELIYPACDSTESCESINKYLDTPVWNGLCNHDMWKYYFKNQKIREEAFYNKDLSYIKNCYVEITEFDCLHDEGYKLVEKLKKDQVNTTFVNTLGTCHGYDTKFGPKIVNETFEKRVDFLINILK